MGNDYKKTLRLPSTEFPMKANLARREPEILAFWTRERIYHRMIEAARARGSERFILHDGPPYANGNIHHGHILNKVLKDIVVKAQNLSGRWCEFIPGWDCHGLPIEHAVEQEIGREQARRDPKGLRRRCREFASHWVEVQSREFQRLGVFGDFEHPYRTMTPDYEALIVREFGRFVAAGAVQVGHKPVLWCPVCETALAEAEVEYRDSISPSVYVRFPFRSGFAERVPALRGRNGSVAIWTTTPWTLPANLAIALHPDATYVAEEVASEVLILAEQRLESFHAVTKLPQGTILARFHGRDLDGATCSHPFLDRESLLIAGEHVTMDTGTGCVHTAPGHGEEDFEVGRRYGLPPYAPVDEKGCFTAEVPEFQGRMVFDCDADIVDLLRERGVLIHAEDYAHSYPHCWRSKNPVVFRATPQWFIAVDRTGLREAALRAIEDVRFIPEWGRARITGMLKSRPDWCISRQRAWGVPIVAVRCRDCGNATTTPALVEHVARLIESEGVDAWFDRDLQDLLPEGFACGGCGGRNFERARDILDVWFESGVSYAAVIEPREGFKTRSDLYLEGSDQHRGWFQSSLLASAGTRGQAPYRTVLTHGFVVDGQGRKLAKSEGNYVDPEQVIQQSGADLLRLWTASEDYRDDIRMSDEILSRLSEAYRKLRNTFRFMLGVVSDLDPQADLLPSSDLLDQDRWALLRFRDLVSEIRSAYKDYEFYTVVRLLLDLSVRDLSAFYLDITKDRLYCGLPWGRERRSAQTAIYSILRGMIILTAPILSFTCEEAWGHLKKRPEDPNSVFLASFPEPDYTEPDPALMDDMAQVLEVRSAVLKEIERLRVAGEVGHPLEAAVHLEVPTDGALERGVRRFEAWLPELFVVSKVTVTPSRDALRVQVQRAPGRRCARCWNWSERLAENEEHPDLCARCLGVVQALAQNA